MPELNADLLSILTVREIRHLLHGNLVVPRSAQTRRATLIKHLLENANSSTQLLLYNAIQQKNERRDHDKPHALAGRKRKREEVQNTRRTVRRVERLAASAVRDTSQFLQLPSAAQLDECYRLFYAATSNQATATAVCAVCARELLLSQNRVEVCRLKDIPNTSRLVPKTVHPAHDLFDGKLLEPSGVVGDLLGDETVVRICQDCMADLVSVSLRVRDKPPRLSLANNLWIGQIPWQLSALTFPEQMLIALLYPHVFVFKLFPKDLHFRPDPSCLQRGLRGNVSTYELDMQGAVSMVQGHLLPRPLTLLPSVISITFIGMGQMSRRSLKPIFRVRRYFVSEALKWLKTHNQRYYGHIEIDAQRLNLLPEDEVPEELLGVIRQTTDIGLVSQESAGYTPSDANISSEESTSCQVPNTASPANVTEDPIDEDLPDVIPLQFTGTVDTDLSRLTANDMMIWGLANLWNQGYEGGYRLRHGRLPVNDFRDSTTPHNNFFEKAFPCLFPYGQGGIEGDQLVPLSFREHVQWALQYHDRRFRKHETFPFVTFGILQRREALGSARVQMQRQNFESESRMLASITLDKLEQAQSEEDKGMPISDPAIRLLRRHVNASSSRIMGSDQSRIRLRSQIWSTAIYLGPPYIWLTINPSDLHDPIAQVFAGETIDLDNFVATAGPDRERRAKNIASDPYAAAKYFHFIIQAILETLLRIKPSKFRIASDTGIFGQVSAYFGTVEAQGRGTLHLHLLLWLKHAPSADEITDLLKSESFRSRLITFIQANFRAFLPGLESSESVKQLPTHKDIAYNRPPKPDTPNYKEQISEIELALARSEQVHTCKLRRCLITDRRGQLICKRKAPFECALDDYVTESGKWGPKRLYGYINAWVPGILVNARCNNDGKFLTNGGDTRNITFYVTSYAAKKQGKHFNLSAILADGFAFHLNHPRSEYINDLKDDQRLLLFRLVHTINREQELSAPMVMSYLMGWGDVYRSHSYTTIYWTSFVSALLKSFPEFQQSSRVVSAAIVGSSHLDSTNESQQLDEANAANVPASEPDDDRVILGLDSGGRLFAKSQVTDYICRGPSLAGKSLFDFFVDTYDEDIPHRGTQASQETSDRQTDNAEASSSRTGRPRNTRIPYTSNHPKASKTQRVIRSDGHRNLPNFVGRYFPRRDDPSSFPFYCACMLMLLKPWHDLRNDLKSPAESWTDAFEGFMSSTSDRERFILSGIQYFHACDAAARESRQADELIPETGSGGDRTCLYEDDADVELENDNEDVPRFTFSEGLANLIAAQTPIREEVHARIAVEFAKRAKLFRQRTDTWPSVDGTLNRSENATGEDLLNLYRWQEQLKRDVVTQNAENDFTLEVPSACSPSASVGRLSANTKASNINPEVSMMAAEAALQAVDPAQLNDDQFRAYDIILWHLEQTLSGKEPPPLRMIVYGEGGTGKSKVIQTVTQVFAAKSVKHLLVKAAYTGVAASLIDGKTTHTLAAISLNKEGGLSEESKAKIQQMWKHRQYLIIDEYSMIAKTFLALLSRNISTAKEGSESFRDAHSFGGVNVILCGDLHQFPPVAQAACESLYHPVNAATDPFERKLGRLIYEEFKTVVVLKQQMRVTDPTWRDLLHHLRHGRVQEKHLNTLQELVINHPKAVVDFRSAPWCNAALVTPRHAVRRAWNEAATRQWCEESGERLYVCQAEDTIGGRELSWPERYAVAGRAKNDRKQRRKDLPWRVDLAVGMRILVTDNVETDLDVTNGARGQIVAIVLNPEEPPTENEKEVRLKYLPSYLLVKLERTRASKLPGLDEGVIPVQPVKTSMRIQIKNPQGKTVQRTVQRKQYPITAAYAFTDYRAQGQTLPYVLVDIATPPTGTLNLFNLYVALSRSSGQTTIRLLRGFEPRLFQQAHDVNLLVEDDPQ